MPSIIQIGIIFIFEKPKIKFQLSDTQIESVLCDNNFEQTLLLSMGDYVEYDSCYENDEQQWKNECQTFSRVKKQKQKQSIEYICNNQSNNEGSFHMGSSFDLKSVIEKSRIKDQNLAKQNARLRREYCGMSQKYVKRSQQIERLELKVLEKEKQIQQLQLFYSKQIDKLKTILRSKREEELKCKCRNDRIKKMAEKQRCKVGNKVFSSNVYGNQFDQVQHLQIENKSKQPLKGSLNINVMMLIQILNQVFQIYAFEQETEKQNIKKKANQIDDKKGIAQQRFTRMKLLRKQFEEHISINQMLEKTNNLLKLPLSGTGTQHSQVMVSLTNSLKSKSNILLTNPLTLDFDITKQSSELENLILQIDKKMSRLKGKKELGKEYGIDIRKNQAIKMLG